MSDRRYDRYDAYEDEGEYEDRSDSYRSRSSYRSARSGGSSQTGRRGSYGSGYADDDFYSTEAYSNSYRSGSSESRLTQSSDARYRGPANSGGYSGGDDIENYRRSAYASGSSRRSSASSDDAYDDFGGEEPVSRYSRFSSTSRRSATSRPATSVQNTDLDDNGPIRFPTSRRVNPVGTSAAASGSTRYQGTVPPANDATYDDEYDYDYDDGGNDGYEPKRSHRARNIIIALVIVLAFVAVGAGIAYAYLNTITENLHEGVDDELLEVLTPTDLAGEPFYMLLMGTDTSVQRVTEEDYGDSARSDSMMLTRIDPEHKKVTLLSIHRDTVVDIEGYGEQKINAAFEVGGPAGAVAAVSKMSGLPISHYAAVDFDGFRAIVDALGGVEVEVPMEINDEVLPAHLDAGWQTLNGEDALVLCRSRHSYDDVAIDGDVMRAANQRMVISAIAKKILASDPITIANTVQTMSQYVTTDMELSDIIGLAQMMKGIDPATDIYSAMEPTVSAYIDETYYEYLDEEAWSKMIDRMNQGLPPVAETVVDEATGTIMSTAGDATATEISQGH